MRRLVLFLMFDLPLYRWWMVPVVLSEILILTVLILPVLAVVLCCAIQVPFLWTLAYGVFIIVLGFNFFLYGLDQNGERHRMLTQAKKDYDTRHANHRWPEEGSREDRRTPQRVQRLATRPGEVRLERGPREERRMPTIPGEARPHYRPCGGYSEKSLNTPLRDGSCLFRMACLTGKAAGC